MPPKKTTSAAPKKAATPAEHPSYKDMIKEAILSLKERNGSSRQAIKKYVQSNFKGIKATNFDSQFNLALKRGVVAGDFIQPKGASGPVKLQKKEAVKPAAKPAAKSDKPAAKKATAPKKTATAKKPKAATASTTTATKPKSTTSKPKSTTSANSKKSRKTATAPAVTDKPAVLTKTKSGRVSKGTTSKAAPKKKAAAAPKKKATPKKKADAAPAATATTSE